MHSSHHNNTQEAQLEPSLPLCCSLNCLLQTGLLSYGERKSDGALIVVWLRIMSVGTTNLIEMAPVHLTIISCSRVCASHTDPVCSFFYLYVIRWKNPPNSNYLTTTHIALQFTNCLWRAGAHDRSLVGPDEAAAVGLSLHSTNTLMTHYHTPSKQETNVTIILCVEKTQHKDTSGSQLSPTFSLPQSYWSAAIIFCPNSNDVFCWNGWKQFNHYKSKCYPMTVWLWALTSTNWGRGDRVLFFSHYLSAAGRTVSTWQKSLIHFCLMNGSSEASPSFKLLIPVSHMMHVSGQVSAKAKEVVGFQFSLVLFYQEN